MSYMSYTKSNLSLEQRAAVKVAINLCQTSEFKVKVLCLKKSKDKLLTPICREREDTLLEQWQKFVDDHRMKVTKNLPFVFKRSIQDWITRLAFEYLSYCRRMEHIFGVTRVFLMEFLTEGDWNDFGRINELSVAERLINSTRLYPLQRYRIMCFYCLYVKSTAAPELWNQLSPEEKELIMTIPDVPVRYYKPLFPETNLDGPSFITINKVSSDLYVLPWMINFSEIQELDILSHSQSNPFVAGIKLAVHFGNLFAIMSHFNCLPNASRNSILKIMARYAVYAWKTANYGFHKNKWKNNLMNNAILPHLFYNGDQYNLPQHYTDVVCFFLLQVDNQMQITFFERFFFGDCNFNVLKIFLDFPYQEHFLPVVRKLWGILPKDQFADCLLTLACKYHGYYDWKDAWTATTWMKQSCNEYQFFDYRSLLWNLWQETPEDYKLYIFMGEFNRNNDDHNREEGTNHEVGHNCDDYHNHEDSYQESNSHEEGYNLKEFSNHEGNNHVEGTNQEGNSYEEGNSHEENYNHKEASNLGSNGRNEGNSHEEGCNHNEGNNHAVSHNHEDNEEDVVMNKSKILLTRLLQRHPFTEKDKQLFKNFLRWVPVGERIKHMHSNGGRQMFLWIALAENLSFANWLLEECLPSNEIAQFKKQFIRSSYGRQVSIYKLEQGRETFLNGLLDWSLASEKEKRRFKAELLYWMEWSHGEKALLEEKNISDIEQMMNFCFSCEEEKKEFKRKIVDYSFEFFLKKSAYDTLDKVLTWCFNSKEKVASFKKDMFSSMRIMDIYCNFVLNDQPKDAKRFWEWCDLSSEDVRKMERDLPSYYLRKHC